MKNTVVTFQEAKEKGEKLSMLTAYDYSTARLIDEAGVNAILVGDSLGMVVLGYEDTLSVTMEDMIDPKFLKYKGFRVCDEADNGIQLWYYPFDENVELPKFKECAKQPYIEEKGYVLYYTSQCPFNAKYVPVIEDIAREKSVQFKAIHLQSKEEAQNAPTPITTYALFLDGDYITNEQMNDKRFLKLLEKQSFNNTER